MTLTPYRFPGGKNKLLPILMQHIQPFLFEQNEFADVFVGGGSVLLAVAQKYPDIKLYANDKDYWISSFWKIISDTNTQPLNNLLTLMQAQPSIALFNQLRNTSVPIGSPNSELIAAYKAIFFNRCCFSGISTSGPIGGQEQKSKYTVDCRYNYDKLKSKILACHQLLVGRTTVENVDFSVYNPLINSQMVCYLDPPYIKAGAALYTQKMNTQQHTDLAKILSPRANWILSYDDCPEIKNLYQNHLVIDLGARYCINGKKNAWKNKNELIILP